MKRKNISRQDRIRVIKWNLFVSCSFPFWVLNVNLYLPNQIGFISFRFELCLARKMNIELGLIDKLQINSNCRGIGYFLRSQNLTSSPIILFHHYNTIVRKSIIQFYSNQSFKNNNKSFKFFDLKTDMRLRLLDILKTKLIFLKIFFKQLQM